MKLPTQKKILREDLKGAPNWVGPLIDTVNSFMENVYQAMNRNITFTDNIASTVREISYRTPSSYPADVEPIQFVSGLKTKAVGIEIWQAYDKATYTPAPGPVYAPWVENNGNIIISTITGLEPNKTYLIRILIV